MSTTIAQTILAQLGGNRFLAMTGARLLCDLGDGLAFNLPRGAKNKANKVCIRLAGDLYRVTFYSIRGTNVTEQTGFDTRF